MFRSVCEKCELTESTSKIKANALLWRERLHDVNKDAALQKVWYVWLLDEHTHTRTWEIWTHPVAASRASNRRAAGRDAQGMKVAAIYPTMPVTTTCSIMHYAQKKTNHEGLFYYCNQMSCFNHKNSLQVNMRCIMYILNINGQLIRQIDFT